MRGVCGTLSNSEVIKQAMGVNSALVVCAQHACRHGLAETPRAADANISIATGKHAIVEMGDEAALVHVDASPAVDGHGLVARIEIYAHVHAHLSSQSQRTMRLKPPKQTRHIIPRHCDSTDKSQNSQSGTGLLLRPCPIAPLLPTTAPPTSPRPIASALLPNCPAVTSPSRAGRI